MFVAVKQMDFILAT